MQNVFHSSVPLNNVGCSLCFPRHQRGISTTSTSTKTVKQKRTKRDTGLKVKLCFFCRAWRNKLFSWSAPDGSTSTAHGGGVSVRSTRRNSPQSLDAQSHLVYEARSVRAVHLLSSCFLTFSSTSFHYVFIYLSFSRSSVAPR